MTRVMLVGTGAILPAAGAVACDEFEITDYVSTVRTYLDRTTELALAAAVTAARDAGWDDCVDAAGLCYGSRWGCLSTMVAYAAKVAAAGMKFAPPFLFTHAYHNAPATLIAMELGLHGPNLVFASGVDSGLLALDAAIDAVRSGAAPMMLAGAAEGSSEETGEPEGAVFVALESAGALEERGGVAIAELPEEAPGDARGPRIERPTSVAGLESWLRLQIKREG